MLTVPPQRGKTPSKCPEYDTKPFDDQMVRLQSWISGEC